jgi:hypothetical protein
VPLATSKLMRLIISLFVFTFVHFSYAKEIPKINIVVRVTRIDVWALKDLNREDVTDPNSKFGPYINLSVFSEKGLERCFHITVGFLKFSEVDDELKLKYKYRLVFPVTDFDCAAGRVKTLDVEIRNRTPKEDLFVALASVNLDKLGRLPMKLGFPSFIDGYIFLEKETPKN